jgi:4-amino-4-deoxy-L-arabinose transferase-like glycosyltransferase
MSGDAMPWGEYSRSLLAVFWLALALLWFLPLDSPHLFDPDEGRYAEIPREMVASGDWVTPRLDAIKYFEKPPLGYWATAVAFEIFGENAWSVRLWPALSGMLGLLLTSGSGAACSTSAPRCWRWWCRRVRCCTSGWRASRRSTWA